MPDIYHHQPSDDENFEGRTPDFATLNRWGNDPVTRAIAVIGIGGQGKTALAGRWLQRERAPELAGMPAFYWSFYEDLDVRHFLQQAVGFCLPITSATIAPEIEPIAFLLRVVQEHRLLFVLDGVEVLQESASESAHGRIRDPHLLQLLQQWLRYPHRGLMLLTSRFPFPQLARYSGVGFHHLELLRLTQADGVSLLRRLGLQASPDCFADYVEKFHGHPLALRVLASTVHRACFGDLAQFEGDQIVGTDPEDRLSQKLERLLSFYEHRLQDGQRELLGIISLFKRPVAQQSFLILIGKMESLQNTALAQADETSLQRQLQILIDEFLVERTREGITTHPVIRDYFRSTHALPGSRREVADFLTEQPGAERPQSVEEVRDLVEAVQLLCDEGAFKTASELEYTRLSENYGFDVFKNLPAPTEGLECYLAFVGDEVRQHKVEKELRQGWLGAYLSMVSLYNRKLGNLALAKEWRYKALDICRQQHNKHNQALDLGEISLIEITLGDIRQAQETISQALRLSFETKKLSDLSTATSCDAYYAFLLGNTAEAYQAFQVALFYAQKRMDTQKFLSSMGAFLLERHLQS